MVGNDKMRTTADVKSFLTLTLIESVGENGTEEDLKRLEDVWRDRLASWAPTGLNTRDD